MSNMLKKLKDALSGRVYIQSILVGIIGVISAFFYNISDLLVATEEELKIITTEYASQLSALLISSSISTFLLVFIAYFIGCKTRKSIKLSNNKMDKKDIIVSFSLTLAISIILYFLDFTVYYNNIKYFVPTVFNPIELLVNILHSGVVEEILFRWGLSTFVIWLFYNIFSKREKDTNNKKPITKPIIIGGVIFSALFIFFFQLESIMTMYGQSWLVIIRSIINYLGLSILLNTIYVKYGLKWSILLHIIFIIIYTGICPLCVYFLM